MSLNRCRSGISPNTMARTPASVVSGLSISRFFAGCNVLELVDHVFSLVFDGWAAGLELEGRKWGPRWLSGGRIQGFWGGNGYFLPEIGVFRPEIGVFPGWLGKPLRGARGAPKGSRFDPRGPLIPGGGSLLERLRPLAASVWARKKGADP